MSHAITVLLTMIFTAVWMAHLEIEIRKDYARAGYVIIDSQAYRLVPANSFDVRTP